MQLETILKNYEIYIIHRKYFNFFFDHLSFIKNIAQTVVTNIIEQRMLLIFKYILNLTFRMLQHTSSEVTVRLNYNKIKTGCGILVTSK